MDFRSKTLLHLFEKAKPGTFGLGAGLKNLKRKVRTRAGILEVATANIYGRISRLLLPEWK
jgi:hypothetical protein